ncbi:hypothetical protein LZG00_15870 [Rhodobacteraceae bacterium LMO-12]|nr:hypothetical protein [Rhodobacteraceae bacterium LMO-JJ12]
MANPQLPKAKAKILGADRKNPKRYRGQGETPDGLSDMAKEQWREFADLMPWLAQSDRQLVYLASLLSIRTTEPDCPLGVFTQLRLCLSSMGGTPVDRSRVQWNDDDEPDPANEFLN